jgi:ribosomal protein S18 acetylase RimI-like enzyme
MIVRRALPGDAGPVARIHVLTWQVAYRGIVPDDYLSALSVERRQAFWLESIERGSPEVWVAEADSTVIGWIAFGPSRDSDAKPGTGEIFAVYVAPSHWSTGAGRRLWLQARERLAALGCVSVSLWVLAKNHRAIRFYEAAGFAADSASIKTIDLGGRSLEEVRFVTALVN